MRLWSLHPQYLDVKGLVALWREALLAKHVLAGLTKGYINHPQLRRFRDTSDPMGYINTYLLEVFEEGWKRGYKFDRNKISPSDDLTKIWVSSGQIDYEKSHLLNKLIIRDHLRYEYFSGLKDILPHPIFKIREGDVEEWEVL